MKKSVVILISMILLACFSLMANGLNNETLFNDSSNSKLLDFSSNHDQSVYVNLVSHAFVISTTLSLEGFLSDWETVYNYTNLNTPVDTEYINSSQHWLVTDGGDNTVYLINPSNGNILGNYSSSNTLLDADYIDASKWLVTEYTKVLLINPSNNNVLGNYSGLINAEAADYVSDDMWLVAETDNDQIILVNSSSDTIVANYSTGLNKPTDAKYVDFDKWLVADRRNDRVLLVNASSDSVIESFTSLVRPESADYISDDIWLITNTDNDEVLLVNASSDTILERYNDSSINDVRDAKYISRYEWLITDKGGSKHVSLEKKYYPNNLTMSVGGSLIKSWVSKFNSIDNVTNFTNALNNYLENNCSLSGSYNIPFNFHSDTSGKLNLSLLNISYNRKPSVNITNPTTGIGWTNNESFNWTMNDDDNDTLSVRIKFFDCNNWNDEYNTSNISGTYNYLFNTTIYADNDCYKFNITVNDSYNNASDETGNFTIDNNDPTISNLRVNDADNITRSDVVLEWRVEANDTFLQTVVLSGSGMSLESGTTYLNSTNAFSLGCVSGPNTTCVLNATATDIVNRYDTTNLTIIIDDVNPVIWNLTSNATSHQADYDEWVNFTVQVSDANLASVNLESSAMTPGGIIWYKLARPSDLGCTAGTVCELTATAADYANNSNSTTYNLTVNPVFNLGSSSGGGSSKPECDDNKDNDGDGLIDMDDPGCSKPSDRDESSDGGACREDWICSDWSDCNNGEQTRTCEDVGGCGTTFFRPSRTQTCTMPSSGLELTGGEEPVVVTPTESSTGVGQAIGLFDRIKANWWAVILGLVVLAGLAALGWKKDLFKRKKNGP